MLIQIELQNLAQTSASKSWLSCSLDRTLVSKSCSVFNLKIIDQTSYYNFWLKFSFKILTKLQPILLSCKFGQNETKELHLVSSEKCKHMSSYTCSHMLPTRASTCFLHVRARYLFVRARLLFKNVRPGPDRRLTTLDLLPRSRSSIRPAVGVPWLTSRRGRYVSRGTKEIKIKLKQWGWVLILPFSSPDGASPETEKPSVDGGVKAGEGERCRGRPKESTRTPGGGANSELYEYCYYYCYC